MGTGGRRGATRAVPGSSTFGTIADFNRLKSQSSVLSEFQCSPNPDRLSPPGRCKSVLSPIVTVFNGPACLAAAQVLFPGCSLREAPLVGEAEAARLLREIPHSPCTRRPVGPAAGFSESVGQIRRRMVGQLFHRRRRYQGFSASTSSSTIHELDTHNDFSHVRIQ
jgi:hypothetical protein